MFKRKDKTVSQKESAVPTRKGLSVLKISILANIAIVALIVILGTGMYVIHQSDTNPSFCGNCHVMKSHVDSYLSSKNLDHLHAQAGVQCKDCHDYPLSAEIDSGIKFITGNYDQDLRRRKFDDEMCTKCHISSEHVAVQTDYLVRNPHLNHWPDLKCGTCHISHGEQVDYCGECHDNGGQRILGAPIVPRADNPWAPGGHPPEDAPGGGPSSADPAETPAAPGG